MDGQGRNPPGSPLQHEGTARALESMVVLDSVALVSPKQSCCSKRRMFACAVVVALLGVVAWQSFEMWLAGRPPEAPVMPLQYTQPFSMGDGSVGVIYYDYTRRTQRVDHWNNSAVRGNQCFFWYNSSEPCIGYMTPRAEQYAYFPSSGTCCLQSCADVCPPSMAGSDGSCCREAAVMLPKPAAAGECVFRRRVRLRGVEALWYRCPVCLN